MHAAADLSDIERWFDQGRKKKATHMLVVCDTFDHEDYPVYVMPGDDVNEKVKHYDGQNMQKVMEVYSFKVSKAAQFKPGTRVWNL